MKPDKTEDLEEYIYIRLTKNIKTLVKERAKQEGSNMTIWIRQLVIKALEKPDSI